MIKAAEFQTALQADLNALLPQHRGEPITEELLEKLGEEAELVLEAFMEKHGLSDVLEMDMGDGTVARKQITDIVPTASLIDSQHVQFHLKMRNA